MEAPGVKDTSKVPAEIYRGVMDHVKVKYPDAYQIISDPQGHEVFVVVDQREQIHYDGYILSESGIFATMNLHKGAVEIARNLITEEGMNTFLKLIDSSGSKGAKDKMVTPEGRQQFYVAELDPTEKNTRLVLKGVLEDAQTRRELNKGANVSLQDILADL